ncbi:SDR family NAD(P)-dependent oxidoreductase [Nocardioides insulae]|uniref:SDR family NAD(P)-dependent oxidoreductase n=1 Tax=Nocardioides insulae TaxID=394734 RepID=UPI00040E77D0|nr:SDR family oxidoreductase [Nocardioides insulae]
MTAVAGCALVTGASRGLGAVIATALAATGMPVAVNYRSSGEAADRVVARITAAGGTARAFPADVTDEASVTGLVADVETALGPIGVLVLNATGAQPQHPVRQLTWPVVSAQLDFFLRSPVLLTTAVVPGMTAGGVGRIIHVGSDVVDKTPVGSAAYVTAKTAQLGFARMCAKELGPVGITVNTVSPGWVPVERHGEVSPEAREAYLTRVPVKRLGRPEDIAAGVVHLASVEASYVNGANLHINGGSTVA